MNLKLKLSWSGLLMSFFFFAEAQKIKIIDDFSKKAIEDVAVFNNDNSIFSVSDAEGFVHIDLQQVKDVLFFQHPAYENTSIALATLKEKNYIVALEEKTIQVDVTVISANKTQENTERISNKVDVLEMKTVELFNPKTSAEVLEASGNIMVQKSQSGGGSPIIRGFEANKVLLVIDGVRMNNLIYRGGHLQNAITIDQAMLQRAEIVYGPGSLIYGSDALGGVVHYYSKPAQFSASEKTLVKGNANIRYANNNEISAHFDINVGVKKFASLSSISFSRFGETKTGQSNKNYPNWGKTPFYVENDKAIINQNPLLQKRTDYNQLDIMQKFKYKENNFLQFELNAQYSTSTNINRYDKLQSTTKKIVSDTSNLSFVSAKMLADSSFQITQPKFSEWYYGPQERILVAFKTSFNKDIKIHNRATYLLSYQNIKESRHKRKFQSNKLTHNIENINIATFNADFRKDFKKNKKDLQHYLLYGMELNINLGQSRGVNTFLNFDKVESTQTRYPENGSQLYTMAFYGKYTHHFSQKLNLSLGARFNHLRLHSKFSQRLFSGKSFSNINNINTAVSGSASLVYVPTKHLQINALVSTGFRAPNVDDIGKVFEPNHQEIVIPNANLKPENTYNFELGFVGKIEDKLRIDLVGYYTLLHQFIQREPFIFNGQDSVFVDDNTEKSQVLANINAGRAYITGVSFNLKAKLVKGLQLQTMLNYTYGRLADNKTPVAHIPPFFGRISLDYKHHQLHASLYSKFSAWKHTWDYSPLSVDNLDEATINGTPAWATLNLNIAYQVNQYFGASFGIENIMNTHYRSFGSAISAPGRNFTIGVKGSF